MKRIIADMPRINTRMSRYREEVVLLQKHAAGLHMLYEPSIKSYITTCNLPY